MLVERPEYTQTFQLGSLTKAPSPDEESKTRATKSVTPRPSKEAENSTVPGMTPTEVGQGQVSPFPGQSNQTKGWLPIRLWN